MSHKNIVSSSESDESDSDNISVLSQNSFTDDDEHFQGLGGRSTTVSSTYVNNKHAGLLVNTQAGLASAIATFDTAKNSAANTHALVGNKGDYTAYSIGTATAVTMYLGRFSIESERNVQKVWGKKAHVHAEMHMLHDITGGDENKIDGCLKGKKIIVDKEICADCYPFILRAAPKKVRDGADGKPAAQRQSWPDWSNPFK